MEAHLLGYGKDGILRASQQPAGGVNPGAVEEVQRSRTHDLMEGPAEMADAQMAQISQIVDGNGLHIIILDMLQGIDDHQDVLGIVLQLLVALALDYLVGMDPQQFNVEGQGQSPDAGLITGLLAFQLLHHSRGEKIYFGIFLPVHDQVIVADAGHGLVKAGSRVEHIPEELLGIKKDIRPQAFRTGRTVSSMGQMLGHTGDVTCFKGNRNIFKIHDSAVGMANADFKTVVEMKPPAFLIRNSPALSAEEHDRKVKRKVIMAVFDNGSFTSGHSILLSEDFLWLKLLAL